MDQQLEQNLASRCAVGDIATRAASHFKNHLAICDGDTRLTFEDVNRMACQFGQALLMQSRPQNPVAIMGRNSWQSLVSYFGCAKAGAVAMPINLGLDAEGIAYCLQDAGVRLMMAESVLEPLVRAVTAYYPGLERIVWYGSTGAENGFETFLGEGDDREPEVFIDDRDPVQLLYTSGTTSRPKGVVTSHLAVTITALGAGLQNQLNRSDRVLHVLPLFHCADLNAVALPGFVTGAAAYLVPGFDPARVADLIEQERLTIVFLLPMMWQALLSLPDIRQRDMSSVRLALFAMAPMPANRLREIAEVFPQAAVLLGSGQTEFTPPTTFQRREHQGVKSDSWGPAVLTVEVGIMDESGQLLGAGAVGEIVYRGPQAMSEYLHQPEATQESFRFGWFHSGDVGWMDEEGVVWFSDRKKDMVKTGGENVASIEVERCLLEHPAVADVSVIGLPHPYWGEAVTALVVPHDGRAVTEDDVIAFAKARLAGFKVPKRVVFVEQFPRTGTGKIQKHLLRRSYQDLFAKNGAEPD